MRNFFIDKLIQDTEKNKKNFLIVGDLGFSIIEKFANKFPKNFLNVGVAEQNMIGIAAGLASEGYRVFVYSIANFPTYRCAEQLRNDIDYHELPVTVVSVGSGFSYGNLGFSHHAISDYGLMRAFSNFSILSPGSIAELDGCMDFIFNSTTPHYLRLDKTKYDNNDFKKLSIKPGEWTKLHHFKKNDGAILTTGTTENILNRIRQINKFRNYNVYSLPIWGKKFKKNQSKYLQKYKNILTVEDHLIECGFGSWLSEANLGNNFCQINCVAYENVNLKKTGDKKYLEKIALKNNYIIKKYS